MVDKKTALLLQDFNVDWRNQAPAGHAWWLQQEQELTILLAAATPEQHQIYSTYPAYSHFYKVQEPVVVTPEAKQELDTILGPPAATPFAATPAAPVAAAQPVSEAVATTAEEAAVAEVISDEEFLSRNLTALRQTLPAEIAAKIEEYKALVITGTADKEGYKKADQARKELREVRLAIERKRKELKEPAITYGKNIENIAKELTALVEPIEKDLAAKLKYIDETEQREALEAARIQREKERAEYEAVQRKSVREQALFGVGMYYNGQSYFSPTAPHIVPVSPEQIAGMDDASWNQMIQAIKQALAPPPPPSPVVAPSPAPVANPFVQAFVPNPAAPNDHEASLTYVNPPTQQAPPPLQENYFSIPYANPAPAVQPASDAVYQQSPINNLPPAHVHVVAAPAPQAYVPSPEPPFMRAETMQDAYNKGYEDAKAAVIHLLTYEPPCSRQDIIAKITNFQPVNQ